jgi:general secretion pathway protein A
MYLDLFGFREKPFSLTPDPRFVFLSKNHREAFAHLLYGVNNHVGFIALTGEVGTGKTTVLRALLSQLDADHYCTALIFNPCLSPTELLQSVNRELGVPPLTSNNSSPLDALNLFLLKQNAEGRTVVLVIDEAQDLEAPVLEQIRLISNLETDRDKLIQIVLSGQPELVRILKRNEMRQLSQRITVRYQLESMDFQDTIHYINHRLEVAGGKGGVIFSRRALKRIYRYSRGLPRLINVACDRALLAGYTRDKGRITSQIASAGIKDMRKDEVHYVQIRRLILIPTLLMLGALLAVGIYIKGDGFLKWDDFVRLFNASQPMEATEKQIQEPYVITGEELFRAMAAELGLIPEAESARRAFNTLAGLWGVPPVPESKPLDPSNGMERAAKAHKLRLYRFSGNLGALLRIDYPAMLEMSMPGIPGKRFISLVGTDYDQLLVDPPIAGRSSLTFSEVEKHWSGQGFLLWQDPLNLMTSTSPIFPGSKGDRIKRLQDLLKEVGVYTKPLTGIYDGDTLSAVKEFQSSKGIEPDGIVGCQTLMLLYRSIGRFEVPGLAGGRR